MYCVPCDAARQRWQLASGSAAAAAAVATLRSTREEDALNVDMRVIVKCETHVHADEMASGGLRFIARDCLTGLLRCSKPATIVCPPCMQVWGVWATSL
jgi:hypothetical protein